MPSYYYKTVKQNSLEYGDPLPDDLLDQLGADGWELTLIHRKYAYFKKVTRSRKSPTKSTKGKSK